MHKCKEHIFFNVSNEGMVASSPKITHFQKFILNLKNYKTNAEIYQKM